MVKPSTLSHRSEKSQRLKAQTFPRSRTCSYQNIAALYNTVHDLTLPSSRSSFPLLHYFFRKCLHFVRPRFIEFGVHKSRGFNIATAIHKSSRLSFATLPSRHICFRGCLTG